MIALDQFVLSADLSQVAGALQSPVALVLKLSVAASAGITRNVLVPVLPDPVTINVMLAPAVAGVTLTLLNTPELNAAEVPVIPAVPLYVTEPLKPVTVLFPISWAVRVIPVMAVPTTCGEEMVEIIK